jgi:hypothetical protein
MAQHSAKNSRYPGDAPLADRRHRVTRGDALPARCGPDTEVARRAGHGVAVLLKIYAHRIDGQTDVANQRITDALSTPESEPGPGDEGADSGPAA